MRGHPGAADLVYYREGGHYIVMRDSDEVLIVLEFSIKPRIFRASFKRWSSLIDGISLEVFVCLA
jgi:hypothetical protein